MSKLSNGFARLYLLSLIIFTGIPCRADTLDYRNVVTSSISYSGAVRVKRQDIFISHAQYKSNFAGLYPEITLSGRAERYENIDNRDSTNISTIGNEVVGGDESAWRSSLSVSGQYYLSNWYKKRFETDYFEKLRDTSIYECETELKKIIREVTDIFRSIAEGKIKLKYANEIMSRFNTISRLKKEASAKGQFSYEDVLKAQADAINMEKDITNINKELGENFEKLSNYNGKAYSVNTEVNLLPRIIPLSIPDEADVILQSPEYKARQKEMEAFAFKGKSVGNNFLPDISLYGRYDLYNSSPDSMHDSFSDVRPTDYSVGLYIKFPLFDGGVRKWERDKTLHELKKAEENARLAFNEKNKEIRTLQIGYAALTKSYSHYKKIYEQYEKILEINRKSQYLGERSKIDIIELEKDVLLAERDLKIIEHTLAVYEQQLALEINFKNFVGDYGGNGTCQY